MLNIDGRKSSLIRKIIAVKTYHHHLTSLNDLIIVLHFVLTLLKCNFPEELR